MNRPYKICTSRTNQYLRGGSVAIAENKIVVAPHASGWRLDQIIGWMHAYGEMAAPAKVTPSRNKREGFYAWRTPAYVFAPDFSIVKEKRQHRHRKHWKLGKGPVDGWQDPTCTWTSFNPPCKESP